MPLPLKTPIRCVRFRSEREPATVAVHEQQTAWQPPVSRARARAFRSGNGDDDAFGRSTHGTSVGTQIKAGLIRLETSEDHGSLTVRAKRALGGRFAMEKRGNGTIEHDASPWSGGSVQHSQSPMDADGGAVMEPACPPGSLSCGQYCSHSKRIRVSSRIETPADPNQENCLQIRQAGGLTRT
jgi:hypothetical protein